MNKDNSLFLSHILSSIEAIEDYMNGVDTKEVFIASRKTRDAVLHNFAIIGEAANNLDEGFIQAHTEVEWGEIIAMRNIVIHEYFGVDMTLVWDTIIEDLPLFKKQIQLLLR